MQQLSLKTLLNAIHTIESTILTFRQFQYILRHAGESPLQFGKFFTSTRNRARKSLLKTYDVFTDVSHHIILLRNAST